MGRPLGSKNHMTNLLPYQKFVNRVEVYLAQCDPDEYGGYPLEKIACRMLKSNNDKVKFATWSKLMEYKYGKPVDRQEIQQNVKVEMTIEEADAIIASYGFSLTGQIATSGSSETQGKVGERTQAPELLP